MTTPLARAVAARRDDLIDLTRNLIRIPTLNPPGQDYRLICEFLDERLKKSGFETQLLRAKGIFKISPCDMRHGICTKSSLNFL